MMEALSMFGAGLVLGTLYFGGLWLTVHMAVNRRRTGILPISQIVRLIGLGAALVRVGATAPGILAPVLLGMLAARAVMLAIVGKASHVA